MKKSEEDVPGLRYRVRLDLGMDMDGESTRCVAEGRDVHGPFALE